MKQIHDNCTGEVVSSLDGYDFYCTAIHEQICERCVACLPHIMYHAKKEGYPLTNRDWNHFAETTWYDPVNGRRIGKKAIKKLVAQIRANMQP